MTSPASNSVTSWPRCGGGHRGGQPGRARRRRPRRGGCGGSARAPASVSRPARGLSRQDTFLCTKAWSRQAWLHAMQVLISSAASACALVDPVRVGQQRPGHRDQLHVRVGEDLLGGLRHVDPVRRHHRDVDVFGHRAADVDERAVGHRGDDRRHPRLVPADAGVDHRRAGRLDFGCQRDDLVPALAVLDVVDHRHPVADDEVRPDAPRGCGARSRPGTAAASRASRPSRRCACWCAARGTG